MAPEKTENKNDIKKSTHTHKNKTKQNKKKNKVEWGIAVHLIVDSSNTF